MPNFFCQGREGAGGDSLCAFETDLLTTIQSPSSADLRVLVEGCAGGHHSWNRLPCISFQALRVVTPGHMHSHRPRGEYGIPGWHRV